LSAAQTIAVLQHPICALRWLMLQPAASFASCPEHRSRRRAAARLVTLNLTLPGWPFVTLHAAHHESAGACTGHKMEEVEDHPFLFSQGYSAQALPGAGLSTGSRPPIENPAADTCRSR
jgi:hypothetical protein